jgi:L-ribulokinase
MEEDPELWDATEKWIDVGDWIVWNLTGREVRSASFAGCKNHWQPDRGGFPDSRCLETIQLGLSSWLDKLAEPRPVGTTVGPLTPQWQQTTGIPPTARVAVGMVDAEAAVVGSDVDTSGVLVAVMGTSTCHLSLFSRAVHIPGIESTVYGAAVDGLYDYCTGQAATGDMLAWFAGLLAHRSKSTIQEIFTTLIGELDSAAGPSPVAAMDWWNGCRTPLGRADLGGILANLTTTTTPVEIYRAMLESAAMGMRCARDLHKEVGPLHEIRVTGGIARFPTIMQLYADVIGETIRANPTGLGSARGAAVSAAIGTGWQMVQSVGYSDYEPRDSERYMDRYRWYTRRVEQASMRP